jgi:UDP-glucose 4-epimerase
MTVSLVTGAAGFIGSHLVDRVIEMGHEVIALDDLSGGYRDNVNPQATFVEGSVVDHDLVNRLFREHAIDYVYHLAAYAAEGLSYFIKRFNYTNNLIGSVNLINASVNAGRVKCLVFTSSIAVYGRNQVPMKEELDPQPEDPYGIAKYAVELDLKSSHEMFGLDHIIFRPHNVYGERQNIADKYRNVIGIFMNQILRREPMTIFGDGEQTRAFSHIDDVAPVIARSVERPDTYNTIFNVGADTPYTVNALAHAVAEAFGVAPRVTHLPARHEVVHAFADHARVHRHFGDLMAGVPLEQGIARMTAWVKERGARATSRFANIEVTKNLPPSWT